MKKIATFIFASFGFFLHTVPQVQAQDFVTPGNQWNIAVYPTFSPNTSSYSVRIGEDTLVNSVLYNKLYYTHDTLNTNWAFSYSYVREDTTKKVFYKDGNANEVLLYDFNLDINDTFPIESTCILQVIDIDTVVLNNGEQRRRKRLVNKFYPEDGDQYWIDGIGSNFGVISHFGYCYTDYPDGFLCFYGNNELLFPESPPSCFITEIDKLPVSDQIHIYPNPLQHRLNIEDPGAHYMDYSLYNGFGELLDWGKLTGVHTQIECSTIPTGFYVLILTDLIGNRYLERMIKID